MYRAILFLALSMQAFTGLAQSPLSATSSEPALVEAQALIDAGKLVEAESSVRRYVEDHPDSADGQNLLGYVQFREGLAKDSLASYDRGGRLRAPGSLDLLVIGCDHMLLEDYAEAARWLTQAVEMDGTNPLAFYYLGRAKYNLKRFDEAISAFQECLKLDQKNGKAQDQLGRSFEAAGKSDEALAAYRAAMALTAAAAASDPGPYLDLGSLLVTQKKADEALPFLVQAVQFAESDERAHRELGKAYLALNQLEKAQDEAAKAVALAPQSAPGHFLLMQVYRKRGLLEKANVEKQTYTALTGAHSAPETPLEGARSLLASGSLSEAEQAVRGYLKTRGTSADGHYLLGYILFKQQKATESLAEYTEAAKYRKPTAADLKTVAGDYVLLKDYPDADLWFSKAVEWNPKDAQAWYYLGRTKYNENRFEEAIGAFQRVLQLEPKNVKAEDNLGLSYEGLNKTEEAAAAYRAAIAWQVDSRTKEPGPFLNLGSLLIDHGDVPEAIANLLRAAEITPKDYRVHRQLGKAYVHQNELDKARAELETAEQLAPESAPVHFMLGQVYRKQGLLDKARVENDRYSALVKSGSATEN